MKKLYELKEEIEKLKIKKAQLDGKISSLFSCLKRDFAYITVEEGRKELEKLKIDIEKMEREFKNQLKELNNFMRDKNE